tara:strand:- start:57 stop:221 length:165 start_codon:yes stop_codon:yes gene_type:complete
VSTGDGIGGTTLGGLGVGVGGVGVGGVDEAQSVENLRLFSPKKYCPLVDSGYNV